MLAAETWVPLAEIARPHGVQGEVRLKPYNRDSELLLEQDEVLLRFPDGEEQEVSVDGARRANDAILMKLHSVDDRDRAEDVRGAVVCVRRGAFPVLEGGEFYACDVQGARVVLHKEGSEPEDVGRVRELRTYPSVDVLVVDASDGGTPWEVPLVDAIVQSVDTSSNVVTLVTLDGIDRGSF